MTKKLKEVKTYHDEEKTKLNEHCFIDERGMLQGSYKRYYENGQLHVKCTYRNDRIEGLYEEYYDNKQLFVKYTYRDGEMNGPCEYYHKNGQLEVKCTYKNGEMNGPYEAHYEDGNLKGVFSNGKLIGGEKTYQKAIKKQQSKSIDMAALAKQQRDGR